jgi:Carbohydrate family 9 binding domain-like
MRCLDQKPAHIGKDDQVWNGDAVEFYLDTRGGDKLGAKEFGPGTLHMFYTAFTGTEVKPRMQVRPLPELKDFKLKDAEVAAEKTPWGWTAEFRLPWAHFPDFKPKAGELLGIDCELCSSDGGPRADRTFVYSSPSSVATPSTFGRVKLVDTIEPAEVKQYSRALLPMSLTLTTNYGYVYATAGVSPTIAQVVKTFEGRILDTDGKERAKTSGNRQTLEGSGLTLWKGQWEINDLPPGVYTIELTGKDAKNNVVVQRGEQIQHGKRER